jgi:hypothetical protein
VVEFRAVTDFFSHKPANKRRAKHQRDNEARQQGREGAKHHILVGVKTQSMRNSISEKPKKMINHSILVFRDQ